MKLSDSLRAEFEREAKTTRRYLERLPDDKLDWRPHEKSFPAGALASHIVNCIDWAEAILNLDEFDFDPAADRPYQAASVSDLLDTFDDKVAICRRALAGADDEMLMRSWRLKILGRVRFEKFRADVFRDFILSHLIHHCGQFSVYLRLLDVPVPGAYGPSADES